MKHPNNEPRRAASKVIRVRLFSALAVVLFCGLVGGPLSTAATPADGPTPVAPSEPAANTIANITDGVTPVEQPDPIAETWGIEITSIRLSANDHMIDYRYKVLDAAKATDLFKRQIKPALIHQETGKVLAVPSTAKLGPLRNSNTPKEGKIYWMFFGNAGHLVNAGDKVTVVIGDFRVEDLVVE
jgi:hypothetical protein